MKIKSFMVKSKGIIFMLLIFLGIFINFVPTMNYYLRIYPNQKSNIYSKDVYIEYAVQMFFAVVNIPSSHEGSETIVFQINNGELILTPENQTWLKYETDINLVISFPLNGTNLHKNLKSSGFIQWDSPLGRLLLLESSKNSVNSSGVVVELYKVPPNVVSFKKMLNPRYFLKPIVYHGNMSVINEEITQHIYLTYYTLEKSGLLLAWYTDMLDKKGNSQYNIFSRDEVFSQLIEILFKNEPSYLRLIKENTEKVNNINMDLGLIDTNLRLANDLPGRILFDFAFTYFPINIALIAIGFIGLVLVHRRRI